MLNSIAGHTEGAANLTPFLGKQRKVCERERLRTLPVMSRDKFLSVEFHINGRAIEEEDGVAVLAR